MNMSVIFMVTVVLASAISVVYIKHSSRGIFIELQELEKQRDELNEEWERLLLEQSTWAGLGRVKQQAEISLMMFRPIKVIVVVIRP